MIDQSDIPSDLEPNVLTNKKMLCSGSDVIKCDNASDICFQRESMCDGISDCPNSFDESVQMCGESELYSHVFQ